MKPTQPLIGITVSKSKDQSLPDPPQYTLSPLYVEGVFASGGAPVQIPNGLDHVALRTIFHRLDGLLLSGGGDVDPTSYKERLSDKAYGVDRERDELEMTLVRWAVEEDKPFFAICRGLQVMNVALGGSLYQDLLSEKPGAIEHAYFQRLGYARDYPAHDVRLAPSSRLSQILGGERLTVNSLHHQGIKSLAPGLMPVAYAPDGLVEAVEVQGHVFAVGVQWHPEALAPNDPVMKRLFDALVKAARDSHDG